MTAADRVLLDAAKLEKYLVGHAALVKVSVPFEYIGGEVAWEPENKVGNWRIQVRTPKTRLRQLELCPSRVIVQAGRRLGDLLTAVTAAIRPSVT